MDADPAVEELKTAAYKVPTDAPEGDGTFAWDSTTLVLVQASAGGVTGLGWTYGPAACSALVGEVLSPAVQGLPALDVGRAAQAMAQATRNTPRPGMAAYAISAADCALWDLKARLLHLPLHRLLGAVRDEVAVYGSGGFTTYNEAQLAGQLGGWVHGQGIPRAKMKIGESFGTEEGRDVERMRQARDIIGPNAALFVDANGAYTAKQAIRIMAKVRELDISWFEEPVSSDNLAGLREVRERVDADVAAGEYGTDLAYYRRMCVADALDCVQADVSRCGGISEWLRIAALAAACNLEISGHCAPHMTVHAAAATPNFRHLEWFHDHVRIENLFFEGCLDPHGGALRPSTEPGNGLAVRTGAMEEYRVA
ncbi:MULTISPECIES: enolase C-terminal domain-like protein [unclassified Arthrobacter]|uniref:enolase C-terminal domain-like protein n=1 Tax=unclassified Arthrobacter TaxID=235627 RepID=UPI00159E8A4E|nr:MULTISPECIES: enolase C-terminal domain-like protein [unclassified Arthrobacter]MCQ9165986.1 mandelate racemase [Arthrobacter sp. STN4]NVM98696.1 mandelate racemase [Arthrobacter sp. SDTb3-6]